MYNIFTFFELYDMLKKNNIQIKDNIISRSIMIDLLSSKFSMNTYHISDPPVCIPRYIMYEHYTVSVLKPCKFEIIEGDQIIMPNKKEYIITNISCKYSEDDNEMLNECIVKLVNIHDDSDELNYDAWSFMLYVDSNNITYKSKWLEYVK